MSTSYPSADADSAPPVSFVTPTAGNEQQPRIAAPAPPSTTASTAPGEPIAVSGNERHDECGSTEKSVPPPLEPPKRLEEQSGPLNRVQLVREQQGVSARTIARRLGIDLRSYRRLEDPLTNLTLQELFALQNALEVPIADLIVERTTLARPVEERAKMIKIMKTAVAMREADLGSRSKRMAEMLCDQLIDLMPELEDVSGWPQFGARRGISAVGKALQQPIDMSNLQAE